MPIYEFFCDQCNVIFNFLSKKVDTITRPPCPKCGKPELEKQVSTFATIGKASSDSDDPLNGLDESRMEKAFEKLIGNASNINEDDPRQMAQLMRKFTETAGLKLGDSMEEAITRMERGEDPEQVEKELGDVFEEGEDAGFEVVKRKMMAMKKPKHDEKLYDMPESSD